MPILSISNGTYLFRGPIMDWNIDFSEFSEFPPKSIFQTCTQQSVLAFNMFCLHEWSSGCLQNITKWLLGGSWGLPDTSRSTFWRDISKDAITSWQARLTICERFSFQKHSFLMQSQLRAAFQDMPPEHNFTSRVTFQPILTIRYASRHRSCGHHHICT